MSFEEEDTCMAYEKEDIWMSYEEEDTCMSYEEEDICMPYEEDTCMSYEEEGYMYVIWGGGYMHFIWGGGYMHVIWGGGYMPDDRAMISPRDDEFRTFKKSHGTWWDLVYHIVLVYVQGWRRRMHALENVAAGKEDHELRVWVV
jgi:hypothetical protein